MHLPTESKKLLCYANDTAPMLLLRTGVARNLRETRLAIRHLHNLGGLGNPRRARLPARLDLLEPLSTTRPVRACKAPDGGQETLFFCSAQPCDCPLGDGGQVQLARCAKSAQVGPPGLYRMEIPWPNRAGSNPQLWPNRAQTEPNPRPKLASDQIRRKSAKVAPDTFRDHDWWK